MVSKASELLPDPETPLITVSFPWGISQEMFFRLCVRAPRMMMASFKGKAPGEKARRRVPVPSARLRAQTAILHYRALGDPSPDSGRETHYRQYSDNPGAADAKLESILSNPSGDFVGHRKTIGGVSLILSAEQVCVLLQGYLEVAATTQKSAHIEIGELCNPKLSVLLYVHEFMEKQSLREKLMRHHSIRKCGCSHC